MTTSTTVQPLANITNQDCINRLVDNGAEKNAAASLIRRISGDDKPSDIYEAAAVNSFVDMVVALSKSGGRLVTVS